MHRQATEVSKHVCELKDSGMNFGITWKVLHQASSYNQISKSCALCLTENYYIICRQDTSWSGHAQKYLLYNSIMLGIT